MFIRLDPLRSLSSTTLLHDSYYDPFSQSYNKIIIKSISRSLCCNHIVNAVSNCIKCLTHSFPMHHFSTPCKHQKTLWLSDVFRGQRNGVLGTNGLIFRFSLVSYYIFWSSWNKYCTKKKFSIYRKQRI